MSWNIGNALFGRRPQAPEMQTIDTNMFYDSAQQYMDPASQQNRQHFDRLRNQAMDMSSMSGMQGQRAMAGGMNPFANEQYQQQHRQGQGQALDAYGGMMGQQQQAGLNLMGLGMQGDMANQQAMNQQRMMQYQADMQRYQGRRDFAGGLFGQAAGVAAPVLGLGIRHGFGGGWGGAIDNYFNPQRTYNFGGGGQ